METALRRSRTLEPLVGLLLVLLVCLVFLPSVFSREFLNWDDNQNFLENPLFHMGFRESLAWAWRSSTLGVFQPVGWVLLRIQTALFGLSPLPFHGISVILHAANTILLFRLLLRLDPLKEGIFACAIAASVFAIHPLHVEAVAWASCQPLLWSVFFSLGSVLSYLDYLEGDRRAFWWAYSWFVAAVGCKANCLSLPLIFLGLRYSKGSPMRWGSDWPFWMTALLGGVAALRARDLLVPLPRLGERAGMPLTVIAEALYRLVWPWNLSPIYPLPSTGVAVYQGIFVALVALAIYRRRQRSRALVWGALAYFVLLLPAIGAAASEGVAFADRYAYLPGLALAALLAHFLKAAPPARRWIRIVPVAVSAGFALITFSQLESWNDSERFWKTALERESRFSGRAHANLGSWLLERGRGDEAAIYLRTALTLDPGLADPWNGLGVWALSRRDFATARRYFEAAIGGNPRNSDAMNNLACAYERMGDAASALVWIDRAIALSPENPSFRHNRARLLERPESKAVAKLIPAPKSPAPPLPRPEGIRRRRRA